MSPAQPMNTSHEDDGDVLMEKVVEKGNMYRTLRRVKKNKGAPEIDNVTVMELRDVLQEHWPRIREELPTGTYQAQPVRRVEIPKPNGGTRLVHKLANTRNGYWRVFQMLSTALGNRYWSSRGLMSLTERYRQIRQAW